MRKRPSNWPRAPRCYHPARRSEFSFETLVRARREDHGRGLQLAEAVAANAKVQKLRRSLVQAARHPCNLASMRYVRDRRSVINGQLLWLVTRRGHRIYLATLMPNGWLIPAVDLAKVEPHRLLEQLRAVLLRAGVGQASGWAYLVLDIEYIEHHDAFSFHLHGVATKEVALVLRSLRTGRKFQWPSEVAGAPRRPVQVKAVRRGHEARVANYLLKSRFTMRVYRLKGSMLVRTKQRKNIPEPRNSELITWLSQWKIDDVVLPINVHFAKDRLKISKGH